MTKKTKIILGIVGGVVGVAAIVAAVLLRQALEDIIIWFFRTCIVVTG